MTAPPAVPARAPRPARTCTVLLALFLFAAPPLRAEIVPADLERGARLVQEVRQSLGSAGTPLEDSWRELSYRGRPSLECKGRVAGPAPLRRVQDFAVYDIASRRLVVYISFPNASHRQAGEAILPISDASTKADARLRAVVPDKTLALESIQRYRVSGEENVYYEVRYAPPADEIRSLRSPARLLLDAMTGELYRFDVDPDWIDTLPLPKNRITRQAAERIAAVALKGRDLAAAFGAGARLGEVVGADLFFVRPNDWLGSAPAERAARPRAGWVVGFTVTGTPAAGPHSLFVDAGSGRVIGGMPGSP
jgi:hypothetical protein